MLRIKEILQIDATILAGILILLTIISFEGASLETSTNSIYLKPNAQLFLMGTGFALSAIFAIFASVVEKEHAIMINDDKDEKKNKGVHQPISFYFFYYLSIAGMLTGFIFLAWIFFVIGEFESLSKIGFMGGNNSAP